MELIKVDYKNYKNLNLNIIDNSINGILTDDSDILNLFSKKIKNYKGTINNNYNKIGFLFKDIDENFGFLKIKDEIKENSEKLLKIFNFGEEILNKSIFDLSSGEKKEIAIIKILSYNPKLIVLDDPFSDLDYKGINNLKKLLKKLKEEYKKTIIIKSNNINDLYFICDNINVFNKTKLMFNCEKKDFINKFKKLESIEFCDYLLKRKKIKLGYYDNVKDLIKAVYRDVGY